MISRGSAREGPTGVSEGRCNGGQRGKVQRGSVREGATGVSEGRCRTVVTCDGNRQYWNMTVNTDPQKM